MTRFKNSIQIEKLILAYFFFLVSAQIVIENL